MSNNQKDKTLWGLRGATTSKANTSYEITEAVSELVKELIQRNSLEPNQIISIIFSVTSDLDACFPASIARQQTGLENVALLDCQQMAVRGDLKRCIRILAYAWLPNPQTPHHPYLREAIVLRPDRASM